MKKEKLLSYILHYSVRQQKQWALKTNAKNVLYFLFWWLYRQISNKRRTKSQNLNTSRLVLQLVAFSKPLKPGVKSRMKMLLEQHRQPMLQLSTSDKQQIYC